jgi:hypothetical protein
MGPVSVSPPSPLITQTQNRVDSTNSQFRDPQALREKLDLSRPSGTSLSRSQTVETRNYKESEKLANNQNVQTTQPSGQRRGSLLDLSV